MRQSPLTCFKQLLNAPAFMTGARCHSQTCPSGYSLACIKQTPFCVCFLCVPLIVTRSRGEVQCLSPYDAKRDRERGSLCTGRQRDSCSMHAIQHFSFGRLIIAHSCVLSHAACARVLILLTVLLPAVCAKKGNGNNSGACQCFATKKGASCAKKDNIIDWPSTYSEAKLGNGGGCAENLCNALAAKQRGDDGKPMSAACCPYSS